jgi:hypothetical protein
MMEPSAVLSEASQLRAGTSNPKDLKSVFRGPVALYMYSQIIDMTTIEITDGKK